MNELSGEMRVLLEQLRGEMKEGFATIQGTVNTAMAKHETELAQTKAALDAGLKKHAEDYLAQQADIDTLKAAVGQSVTWKAFWLGLAGAIAAMSGLRPILDIIINK